MSAQRGCLGALLACTLLVLALEVLPAAADWRICASKPLGVFKVTGAEVEPYPGHAGDEVVFRVQGSISDVNVSSALLEVSIVYLGFHVYSSTGELCNAVACPLEAGPQTLEFNQPLPWAAPPGHFVAVLQATARGGPLLFCVDIDFRVALSGTAGRGGGGAGGSAGKTTGGRGSAVAAEEEAWAAAPVPVQAAEAA